jgi:hypothetical protein
MSRVIQLDGRRGLAQEAEVWDRRFQNDVNAAVDAFAQRQPLEFIDTELMIDDPMAAYDDGPDVPEIVRSLARKAIGDLVRAAIEKRGQP